MESVVFELHAIFCSSKKTELMSTKQGFFIRWVIINGRRCIIPNRSCLWNLIWVVGCQNVVLIILETLVQFILSCFFSGIEANKTRIDTLLNESLMLVTCLNSKIGWVIRELCYLCQWGDNASNAAFTLPFYQSEIGTLTKKISLIV